MKADVVVDVGKIKIPLKTTHILVLVQILSKALRSNNVIEAEFQTRYRPLVKPKLITLDEEDEIDENRKMKEVCMYVCMCVCTYV